MRNFCTAAPGLRPVGGDGAAYKDGEGFIKMNNAASAILVSIHKHLLRVAKLLRPFCVAVVLLFSTNQTLGGVVSKELRPPVSEARLARLARGINLAHWFSGASLNPIHLQAAITQEDIEVIKRLGFRHVRLPLDPEFLLDETTASPLSEERLSYLDAALDLILLHGLAVIVDFHPQEAFKRRLTKDPAFLTTVSQLWKELARHLSNRNPEVVFLEALNEPGGFTEPSHWANIQRQLLEAMREGAPEHTLIATGSRWSKVDGLLGIEPLEDPNVVYTFHFYMPPTFTHQGAMWIRGKRFLHGLPYPSDPKAVAEVIPRILNSRARKEAQRYGEERWNRDKLEIHIRRAAIWARQNKVPVISNEFGVYRRFVPRESRLAWIRDVRTLLERYKIGWSFWEYNGGFGIVRYREGKPVADEGVVLSLGLLN